MYIRPNQSANFANVIVHDTFQRLRVALTKDRLLDLSRPDLAAIVQNLSIQIDEGLA